MRLGVGLAEGGLLNFAGVVVEEKGANDEDGEKLEFWGPEGDDSGGVESAGGCWVAAWICVSFLFEDGIKIRMEWVSDGVMV